SGRTWLRSPGKDGVLLSANIGLSLYTILSSTDADQAAGARAEKMTSRNAWGSSSTAVPPSTCRKTHSPHSHRRTAVSASEKVVSSLQGQATAPDRFASGSARYGTATAAYSPDRQGAARSTVCR